MSSTLPVEPVERLRLRRSAKWRTHPADVLPLFVAETDFSLAPAVQQALREAVERSDTGYGMPAPELGDALARFAEARWGWSITPSAVSAVPDVGVGVVELLRAVTRPGDAVVISPPVYAPFFGWPMEARTEVVEVPLSSGDGGWRLDLPALERAFSRGPAAYLLGNPHNPVGRVHAADELAELVGLATRHGVVLISDEIHAPLVLPGDAVFTPLLTVPGAAEVAVSLLSASKAWNLAGLKCAAVVSGSDRMAEAVGRIAPDVRWRVGHLGVLAAVAAFGDGAEWLDDLLHTLDDRRRHLGALIDRDLPGVSWRPPEATYLAWLDCRALGLGDDVAALLLEHGRVALEPGLRFGREGAGFVRLNFGTSREILDDAVARTASALSTALPGGARARGAAVDLQQPPRVPARRSPP